MQEPTNLDDISCNPICGGQYFTKRAWILEEDCHRLSIQYVQNNNIIVGYIIPIGIAVFVSSCLLPIIEPAGQWRLVQILITGFPVVGTIAWIMLDKLSACKEDWLIYDKELHTIELPRSKVKMNKDSLACLQIIIDDSSLNTEVNIVFLDGSKYVRYPLMRAWTPRMVWRLTFELSKKLHCPRYKVEYTILGECKKSEIRE